jgi:hypothetical protein
MITLARSPRWVRFALVGCALTLLAITTVTVGQGEKPMADPAAEYTKNIQPFLSQYCLGCHSTKKKKGELDLERFASLDLVRKDTLAWQSVAEMLENGEMPPKGSPQPSAEERRRLIRWTRGMLDTEARARGGDPGRVVVRRLTNAEFNNTIRDLTGVDLQPARDFPVDGAAGEGFTNTGDALVLSPTLLNKYLNAAKEMATHVVLVPDGFRFSPATTRRDWTDEILTDLRTFYKGFTPDGKLPLQPYLAALLRLRDDLTAGKTTLENVAVKERLNLKYLRLLWQTLNDDKLSFPLDRLRDRFRTARPADASAILAEINAWQTQLWRFVPIGSYRDDNLVRQLPNDPAPVETQTLRLPLKPAPGQSEVVLYLTARQFPAANSGSHVVWRRPRFEAAGKPALLLRDYPKFGEQFEFDYRTLFADTPKYLTAALESAQDRKLTAYELARKHGIDVDLLKRWIEVLAIEEGASTKTIAAVPLELLPRKLAADRGNPALNGWRHPTNDLPIVLSNSSDKVELIPGKASPHRVVVHPLPDQFVAVAWNSPIEASVRVSGKITHAHPACGNGVAWWIEHRHDNRASLVAEGVIDVGKEAVVPAKELKVSRGDLLVLVIDARDGNHVCDLTEINFTISEPAKDGRTWDLAKDVADNILEGNPHADRHGNRDVWRFVKGPSRPTGKSSAVTIPAGSILAQ